MSALGSAYFASCWAAALLAGGAAWWLLPITCAGRKIRPASLAVVTFNQAGYAGSWVCIPVGEQYYHLPHIKIQFDDDKELMCGTVKIQNHIKTDSSLASVNLSSALGVYVVDAQYIEDDNNYYCFEISDSRIDRQLKFSSYTELTSYAKKHTDKHGPYTLFCDARNQGIRIRSLLLVGITGSGKSYALMGLLAQLLNWSIPPIIFFADPKGSDIAVLGGAVAPDRTADDIDGIIDLLRRFTIA